MIQRQNPIGENELRQLEAALTEANLQYLAHCVRFWLAVKPPCGVKSWLEYSIRRSTHRLATDGLQETIARLSDEDLLRLHKARFEAAQSTGNGSNSTERHETAAQVKRLPVE